MHILQQIPSEKVWILFLVYDSLRTKKSGKENILIAGYISEFLDSYVLSQKTSSMHTLKSYQDAIVLYLSFLEDEKKVLNIPVSKSILSGN